MNDNTTILQKIKDNAFYIALGVGILAIIALIAVYTMGRDGGAYEENEIDLNRPSDYSSISTENSRDKEQNTGKDRVGRVTKEKRKSSDKKASQNNKSQVSTENTQQSSVPVVDSSQSNVPESATSPNGEATTTEAVSTENAADGNNAAGNAAVSKVDNASDDGKQLPVTADVGELNFGSDKTLSWPVKGEVILPFSMETTVYYKTMDQYRTNPGMLIAAGNGSTVKNAYLGKVVKVTSDNTYGNLVTIYLGNDYSIVYGQLDTIYVKEGDYVKAGESVGTIGKPTDSFEEEGSHLFFEMQKGDTPVDPMEFME